MRLFLLAGLAAVLFPATAHAGLIPPAGPWPTDIVGLVNPLAGTALPTNGTNATANVNIQIWLMRGNQRRNEITRVAGQWTTVHGVLTNRDTGKRIGGAAVVIVTENPAVPGWSAATTVLTGLNGRYRAVLPPPSAHRRIAAVYFPDQASTPLTGRRVLVRAKSSTILFTPYRHGGRNYRFDGVVRAGAAPIPPGGLIVALQAKNSQGVWLTTKIGRTTATGNYRIRYRFPVRGRLRVRVVTPAQNGWDFYSGKSSLRWVRP